jgi:hypothetical protein
VELDQHRRGNTLRPKQKWTNAKNHTSTRANKTNDVTAESVKHCPTTQNSGLIAWRGCVPVARV